MGLLRDCNMHIFRLKLYQPSCCEMLQIILALIYFSTFPAWVHWLPRCHRYQCLIAQLLLSIHPSISKLGWLFCLLSAHQLLVHWCLHSPFQTSSNMAYYMSAIVDKVTLWAGVDSDWTRRTLHPPLHTPAPAASGHPAADTHCWCWWRGDVSSSHTSRWSHTACRAELPLVKRFQWRAVIGPGTIYTRIGKCLHYNYVSGMNRAAGIH